MKKSAVAGVAGSIRIAPLSLAGLKNQERHGKREDLTSQARVIRDVAPLVTNGLDLRGLYEPHVEGCFVPKGKTKVLQVLIQFPRDLVDLQDEAGLLHHALMISKRIWGDECIMAARYDRDEKSQGVADVFVVPKYLKRTKANPEGRRAVSITKHGKDLARKWDRMTGKGKKGEPQATPWDVGRALQDELYDYLKNVMHIEGVKRGEPKKSPGPDWKAAEQLRDEELTERALELDAKEEALEQQEKKFEKRERDVMAAEKRAEVVGDRVLSMLDKIPELEKKAKDEGYASGYSAGARKAEADGKAKLEAERKAAEEKRTIETREAEAVARKITEEAEALRQDAQIAKSEADSLRQKARKVKEETEAVKEKASQERSAIQAGLDALERGDILAGLKEPTSGERRIVFREDLDTADKNALKKAIRPIWNWLSEQAERISAIAAKRTRDREAEISRRENEVSQQLGRNAARERELDQTRITLGPLIDRAKEAWFSINASLEPILGFRQKYDEAAPMIKQVMARGPRLDIVTEALADPKVIAARAAETEIDELQRAFEAMENHKNQRQ